jgi:hypothetical protein
MCERDLLDGSEPSKPVIHNGQQLLYGGCTSTLKLIKELREIRMLG